MENDARRPRETAKAFLASLKNSLKFRGYEACLATLHSAKPGVFRIPVRPLRTMKTLPKTWSDFLQSKGETGMGYQVVAVTLRDGRKIEDVTVVQSHIVGEVRGHEDIPFEPEDIVGMELTHRRWQFRR